MSDASTNPDINKSIYYAIIPAEELLLSVWRIYWESMLVHKRLQPRFHDIPDITPARAAIMSCQPSSFAVIMQDNPHIIAGEFTLTDITTHTARIHFSVHPSIKPFAALAITKNVIYDVLHDWKKQDSIEPYVNTLVGVTPLQNKQALAFIERVGFKRLGIIPQACQYEGRIDDSVVSYITRKDLT